MLRRCVIAVSYHEGRPGRDHWPQAMSVLVSGGGLKMGQVVGSTDDKGEHPVDRPLSPNDLWATSANSASIRVTLNFSTTPAARCRFGRPIAELL